jgi:hypothetical protein
MGTRGFEEHVKIVSVVNDHQPITTIPLDTQPVSHETQDVCFGGVGPGYLQLVGQIHERLMKSLQVAGMDPKD